MSQPIPTKRITEFVETTIGDEVLLLHLESGEFLSLTGSAADIWKTIDGRKSTEEIIREMTNQHVGGANDIPSDVTNFLEQLRHNGLLEYAG